MPTELVPRTFEPPPHGLDLVGLETLGLLPCHSTTQLGHLSGLSLLGTPPGSAPTHGPTPDFNPWGFNNDSGHARKHYLGVFPEGNPSGGPAGRVPESIGGVPVLRTPRRSNLK
jgi:hypothetical protein